MSGLKIVLFNLLETRPGDAKEAEGVLRARDGATIRMTGTAHSIARSRVWQ